MLLGSWGQQERQRERERVNGVWGRGGVPANMGGKP